MKRSYIIIVAVLFCLTIYSQTISVSSFKLLETDLTANTAGTIETDQNGETAALIKVVTTQTGFTFDGGALGIVKTKQTPGEVWVYVPKGSKKISVKHPQLGVLRDYYYPIAIEAARTYEMKLVTGEVQTLVKEQVNSQYLVIQVTPANAIVELDNEILPVSDGIAHKFLKFGTYDYRVQAQNYHTSAGKITIDNPKEKEILAIKLQPAFGWVKIGEDDELAGALVYIDNTLVGSAPIKSDDLASGNHNIKIVKPLYHAFEEVINIRDNEVTEIHPRLKPDYSIVTISVDDNADIYVNDEFKGHGTWTGKLSSGTYVFEARKSKYRKTISHQDITSLQKEYNFRLEAPSPILGSININSEPPLSDIFIDGNAYGQTPLFLNDLLIGNHSVIIKRKGYSDYKKEVYIKENETTEITATLLNIDKLDIDVFSDKNVNIYIDGKYCGTSRERRLKINVGKHYIQVHNPDFGTYGKELEFYENGLYLEIETKRKNISLKKK